MLNTIGFPFIVVDNLQLYFLYPLAVAAGGLIAFLTLKAEQGMRRVPYFAWSSIVMLYMREVQFLWVYYVEAERAGRISELLALALVLMAMSGFVTYRLAMARSIDAFGNTNRAWFGLIPFLNLWLLFALSKEDRQSVDEDGIATAEDQDSRQRRSKAGRGIGITFGIMCFAIASGSEGCQDYHLEQIFSPEYEQELAERRFVRGRIKENGLSAYIAEYAERYSKDEFNEGTPRPTHIVADGRRLVFIQKINEEDFKLTIGRRGRSTNVTCTQPYLSEILRAGGQVAIAYQNSAGETLAAMSISQDDCP